MVASTGVGRQAAGQQPACLHGANSAPEHAGRRRLATAIAREINTLQLRVKQRGEPFQPLDRLGPSTPIPNGFVVNLVTDGNKYAFSMKDTTDPCHFGLFSDEGGVISQGESLR